MSGSIGANRIPREAVENTFNAFIDKVLKKFPGFKTAKISGSYNTTVKPDHGDLDLVIHIENSETDKKKLKQNFASFLNSLPDDIIPPFRSGRHKDKKSAGTGDIVITQFPIEGFPGLTVQIDNMIVVSEQESVYRKSFLDLPAEKQGLLVGLAKTILLEEDPDEIFSRLHITNLPKLKPNQEFEFNLSNKGLTLRLVTLGDDYREKERTEVWNSFEWSDVLTLFKNFDLSGNWEKLLTNVKDKLKNPRSKNRVKGVFKSLVVINTGEEGTSKGEAKKAAIAKVSQVLSEALKNHKTSVAIYAGGFKPPHKAHFENAKILSAKSDKLIVFIGSKIREGEIKITPEQSKEIWEIYSKYISVPVEIRISPVTPIKDTYDWVDANQDKVDEIITGTTAEEMKKFAYFVKNASKYPKVKLEELPIITSGEDEKFSASDLRKSEQFIAEGSWVPSILSEEDKKEVIDIILPKVESFKKFFSKKFLI
jgi:nicotinamide mononucleotide adenylyltransferase